MSRLTCSVMLLAVAAALPAVAGPLPAPWVAKDIGEPNPPGATDVDASGVWTIQGGGKSNGIGGASDRFYFVYQPIKGDASITARFLGLTGGLPGLDGAGVGLMVRENDSPGSPNLSFAVTSGGFTSSARFQPRRVSDFLGEVGPEPGQEANLYLRLQRVGNEMAAFYSRDSRVWIQADFAPRTLPTLPEEALFGLSVASQKNGALTTGKLDSVQVQTGTALVSGVTACGGNGAVLLQWRPLKGAKAYNVYRGPAPATPGRLAKLNTDRIAASSFTDNSADLVNGTLFTYAVAAVFPGANGQPVEGPLVAVAARPVAMPPGLLGCSLNEGPNTGSAAVDPATGQIALRGSGIFYFDNGEQGYFLGQSAEGDVQVTTRLLTPPTGNGRVNEAGLMVRESLDTGARNLMIQISHVDPPRAIGWQWRTSANMGATREWRAAPQLPVLLRLTRHGNTITPEYSADDGKTFQAGRAITFDPPLANVLDVGLFVTSDDRSQSSQATFSGLEVKRL
jgi:regulation of enolase protein 1 (concanavalin A-like superfamily)